MVPQELTKSDIGFGYFGMQPLCCVQCLEQLHSQKGG